MKLVLIDGNAIMHRAYHALPPLTNREGKVVNAVYGFWNMLFRAVDDLVPTHLVVAFDTEKPTFRHAAFVGYQAQRPRVESDLSEQFDIVQDTLRAGGVPVFTAPGYEADDVIGTLAKQAKSDQDMEVIIITGDRDLLQLVDKNVKVYMPIKGLSEAKLLGRDEVVTYLGITPDEVVDYKALVGDPSDNYPGVPGIGPKTAIDLIQRFKTVDGIYKAISDKQQATRMGERLINKLVEGHESAILSRQLAQIEMDVPVTLDLEHATLTPFVGNKGLVDKFGELSFRSLLSRVQAEGRLQKSGAKSKKPEDQLKLM